MPILTAVPIKAISQDEFHQIDRRVTGLAFEIHNEFGRYLDERLYRGELNRRCQRAGLRIEPEMRMTISTATSPPGASGACVSFTGAPSTGVAS